MSPSPSGPILYAGAQWIGGVAPENYFVGRLGYGTTDWRRQYTITAIGLHHTATTLQGAIDTFQAPPASGRQHSAHFIVDLDGSRYQMLDTNDTAFALGDEAANCYTVNIEVVQTWDFTNQVKTSDFTAAQYASVSDICRIVAADNGFAVSGDTVHGHNFWTQTTCPADLDIARIIQGGFDLALTPDQEAQLVDMLAKFPNLYRTTGDLFWALQITGADPDATKAHSVVLDNVKAELDALKAQVAALPAGGDLSGITSKVDALAVAVAHINSKFSA